MRGFNFAREQSYSDNRQLDWIRPAPRASGLRPKQECGVPFSYEERQNKNKKNMDVFFKNVKTLYQTLTHSFSYIKSLSVASLRVSDYFKSGKWLQFIITIFNMDFLPIFFNQIAILSASLAVYRH